MSMKYEYILVDIDQGAYWDVLDYAYMTDAQADKQNARLKSAGDNLRWLYA